MVPSSIPPSWTVTRNSVGLTYWIDVVFRPRTDNLVLGLKPRPRTRKLDPGASMPPPGSTFVIETLPPTVMLPCWNSNEIGAPARSRQIDADGSRLTAHFCPATVSVLSLTAAVING